MKQKSISIRNFFQTGSLSGVLPGMTRQEVELTLGHPDDFLVDPVNQKSIYEKSPVWVYRGIEVCFSNPQEGYNAIISEIHFNPSYLWRRNRKIKKDTINIHRWIFQTPEGPSIQELLGKLSKLGLEHQDTGLQMLLFDRVNNNFKLVDYQEENYQAKNG